MTLKLMFITNDEKIAKIAEQSGVDWIFIDLEIMGKDKRQGHLDTVISRHTIADVKKIRNVLSTSELLVRVNPLYEKSKQEIDEVIENGADIIMLPYFKTSEEVRKFIDIVDKRVKTCILLETPEAVDVLKSILSIRGIDYIHIGLNDLHLGYKMKFMFELLADGTVEKLCKRIKETGIPYGFGGIARVGQGTLPAERIIAEHYRLGSTMDILSRTFCNAKNVGDYNEVLETFNNGVKDIRVFEKELLNKGKEYFDNNTIQVKLNVGQIVNQIKKKT